MKRRIAAIALVLAAPASAQSMPGMDMPAQDSPPSGHDHAAAHPAAEPSPGAAAGTALPAGNAPAPRAPADHHADRY